MKPFCFLDLALFAIPNHIETEEEIEELFGNLISWGECIRTQNCFTFATSDDAVDILTLSNCFPAIHNIQALLDLYDLGHVFAAKDLNKSIFSILSRVNGLQETLGVSALAVDQSDLPFNPMDPLGQSSLHLISAVGLLGVHNPTMSAVMVLVPGFGGDDRRLSASCIISGDVAGLADATEYRNVVVEFCVELARAPAELLRSISADAAWELAECDTELGLPIALKAVERLGLAPASFPCDAGRQFSVGEGFHRSLVEHHAVGTMRHSGSTLGRCAIVVADNSTIFERDFGENRDADGAGSRRVHIGKAHEALRLFFWEKETGEIEFANVGVKHELKVKVGDPDKAFQLCYKS